jgi:hypothetical protein
METLTDNNREQPQLTTDKPATAEAQPPSLPGTLALASKDKIAASEGLMRYRIGDTFSNGEKIVTIYLQSERFLVFLTDGGFVSFEDMRPDQIFKAAHGVYQDLMDQWRIKLRCMFKKDFMAMLAQNLSSALRCSDVGLVQPCFDNVRKFLEERAPITYVYGCNQNSAVYLDNKGVVRYEYYNDLSQATVVLKAFHRLQHIANCALPEEDKKESTYILGVELTSAFSSPGEVDPSSYFVSSTEFINNRCDAILRSNYIKKSMFAALALLALLVPVCVYLWWAANPLYPISLGSVAGLLGAAISIIQRGVSLKVNPFVPAS